MLARIRSSLRCSRACSEVAETRRSRHPRLPQAHGGPCGSREMWPISPPAWFSPNTGTSPSSTAPPTPRRRRTNIILGPPLPNSRSVNMAAVASLFTVTGSEKRRSMGVRTSTLRQPSSVERFTRPLPSTTPGMASPMPMTFCVAACRGVMTSLMVSKSTWFTARSACSTCMTGSPSRFVASPWMRCGCDRSMLMICSVSGSTLSSVPRLPLPPLDSRPFSRSR